ncbi:OLC1v1021522C1 [Oldenlandia corymbosa var. corymbosa]|uniref:CASP-like protein n=1 Tax=Oldenlandia corymbosa var. corymbosa TaxID=529605 RepID=A0AAV1BVV0_OLDCO|nr:OLC1v1021522C1 [Oldenlandia corymbosa var. corymbosa]
MMDSPKRIPIFVLRLIALGAAVTAAILMFSAHDTAHVFNMTFEAKYTNSPTFKYFLIINAVASVYSLLVLCCPTNTSMARFLLVMDLIILLLLDSAISSNVAIGQVGRNGNSHAGWLPICNQVPKFCKQTTAAVIGGFVASLSYLFIVLCSFHNEVNLLPPKD